MARKKSDARKARPFPWPCANCLTATVVPTVLDHATQVKHDGVVYDLVLPGIEVPRCSTCGTTVITEAVDDLVTDALRARLALLAPAQMKAAIERLGLKQQELAARIGVAPETVSRWVNGVLIQSRAMDNLLRLFFALPEVRDALPTSGPAASLGVGSVAQRRTGKSKQRCVRS